MKSQDLNTLNHCTFSIQAHLVIVTKYRKKVITADILDRLHEIFTDLMKKWGCELIEFNGESDHVHLLISVKPDIQPSKLVNNLKTVSSRLIRRNLKNK